MFRPEVFRKRKVTGRTLDLLIPTLMLFFGVEDPLEQRKLLNAADDLARGQR